MKVAGFTIARNLVQADYPLKEYMQRLGERPTVQRVTADRKENTEQMRAWRAAQQA